MIVGRCVRCTYVARYSSNYFSISELQRHVSSVNVIEQNECNHELRYVKDEES